jgi:chemotaxis protein MotB
MRKNTFILFIALISFALSSCVSKKKFTDLNSQLEMKQEELFKTNRELDDCIKKNGFDKQAISDITKDVNQKQGMLDAKEELVSTLRDQIADLQKTRDSQLNRVGDLTALSKTANDNITSTLKQLEGKDQYISMLQRAKTKADSMNLALAVNLKQNLAQGINDSDIEVSVDKTVVFINLSDKMLYRSGSAKISSDADEVLAKIASIIVDRPDLEVMVEGYTDDKSISTDCMEDNWDLSAKRATSVVRALETKYGVNPSRLIAAGRGETNPVADNATNEGRTKNRRTRIVLMPQLDQFYDLLAPSNMPK